MQLKIISPIIGNVTQEACCCSAVMPLVPCRLECAKSQLIGMPVGVLQKLQVMRNNATRVIHRLPGHVHITPVLRELHWLPIRRRITHSTWGWHTKLWARLKHPCTWHVHWSGWLFGSCSHLYISCQYLGHEGVLGTGHLMWQLPDCGRPNLTVWSWQILLTSFKGAWKPSFYR